MGSLDDISSITTLASDEENIFWSRFNCVYNWFLKASTKTKLKLLKSMLDSLKDDSYLDIFLSCFNYNVNKLIMYSDCYPTTNYIYDIYLKDHNRGLQTDFLLNTIRIDTLWYNNLDAPEQVRTISELLRVSGGAIIKEIYKVIREKVKAKVKCKATDEAAAEPEEKEDLNLLFLPKPADPEDDGKKKKKKTKKGEKKPKTQLEQDIEHKKKAWDDEIRKYRIAVEGKPAKKSAKGKKGKGKGKGSKSGTTSKSSKSSKKSSKKSASKKSKKSGSKKGKKGEKSVADRVQMLPVWVVKRIFNYLDNKTLKKIREVNSYWAYVVDDMAKDKKNMAAVQKIVKKMQANLSGQDVPDLIPSIGKPTKLTQVEKRMVKLVERGAVDKRLRTIIKQPVEGKTLLEKAIALADTRFRLPTASYEAFPREQGTKLSLLNLPKLVCTEAGVVKYDKKAEGGAVTIVELTNYDTIDSALHSSEHAGAGTAR